MNPSVHQQSPDETQIRRLLNDQQTAMRERDADYLASRYTPDAVVFGLAPPLATSGEQVGDPEPLRRWFDGFDGPIDVELRDVLVTAGEDVAFCQSLNRLSATPHGMPTGFDLWFRATVCLRKVDGDWRIAHEHNSTPFSTDGSFRAALDLTP